MELWLEILKDLDVSLAYHALMYFAACDELSPFYRIRGCDLRGLVVWRLQWRAWPTVADPVIRPGQRQGGLWM